MAYLPYAPRHVQKSVEDVVLARLTALGWLGPANAVPFGAPVVDFQRGRMDESALAAITGNIVTVSWGNEPDDEPQELGGGLQLVEHYLFVDVVGEKEAHALAIASDVKDLLSGRAPGTKRYVTLLDQGAEPPTPVLGYTLELVDVIRQEGDPKIKRNWQIVKATVEQTYQSEEDGS